jgi:hypothetical protein
MYFQDLSSGILKAPKFSKLHAQKKKEKIYSRLVTADQGGQKNRNGQTSVVLFLPYFLLVLTPNSHVGF